MGPPVLHTQVPAHPPWDWSSSHPGELATTLVPHGLLSLGLMQEEVPLTSMPGGSGEVEMEEEGDIVLEDGKINRERDGEEKGGIETEGGEGGTKVEEDEGKEVKEQSKEKEKRLDETLNSRQSRSSKRLSDRLQKQRARDEQSTQSAVEDKEVIEKAEENAEGSKEERKEETEDSQSMGVRELPEEEAIEKTEETKERGEKIGGRRSSRRRKAVTQDQSEEAKTFDQTRGKEEEEATNEATVSNITPTEKEVDSLTETTSTEPRQGQRPNKGKDRELEVKEERPEAPSPTARPVMRYGKGSQRVEEKARETVERAAKKEKDNETRKEGDEAKGRTERPGLLTASPAARKRGINQASEEEKERRNSLKEEMDRETEKEGSEAEETKVEMSIPPSGPVSSPMTRARRRSMKSQVEREVAKEVEREMEREERNSATTAKKETDGDTVKDGEKEKKGNGAGKRNKTPGLMIRGRREKQAAERKEETLDTETTEERGMEREVEGKKEDKAEERAHTHSPTASPTSFPVSRAQKNIAAETAERGSKTEKETGEQTEKQPREEKEGIETPSPLRSPMTRARRRAEGRGKGTNTAEGGREGVKREEVPVTETDGEKEKQGDEVKERTGMFSPVVRGKIKDLIEEKEAIKTRSTPARGASVQRDRGNVESGRGGKKVTETREEGGETTHRREAENSDGDTDSNASLSLPPPKKRVRRGGMKKYTNRYKHTPTWKTRMQGKKRKAEGGDYGGKGKKSLMEVKNKRMRTITEATTSNAVGGRGKTSAEKEKAGGKTEGEGEISTEGSRGKREGGTVQSSTVKHRKQPVVRKEKGEPKTEKAMKRLRERWSARVGKIQKKRK